MNKQKIDYKKLNKNFAQACLNGDFDVVKDIYNTHITSRSKFNSFLKIIKIVNSFDPHYDKNTALAHACLMGHFNIVEFLINQEKFKSKLTSNNIQLGLQFAISSGHTDIVELLLPLTKKKLRLYITVDMGLKLACQNGHLDTIKYFTISPNVDFDNLDEKYRLPDKPPLKYACFLAACAGGQVDVMKFLLASPELQKKVDINYLNDPSVHVSMPINSIEVINYLIFDLNLSKNDPLIQGIKIDEKISKQVDLLFEKQELFSKLSSNLENESNVRRRPKL
jgi:ankyrin repeat protein